MTPSEHTAPWSEPGWLETVTTWAGERLTGVGVALSGALQAVRVRPWSALWRAPTSAGLLWLKACAPAMRHEAALLAIIHSAHPDVLPPLYAVDAAQGLILMEDGGDLLRPRTREARDLSHWTRILPLYALLQQELAPHHDAMLSAGVLDRRTQTLPALYAGLLADVDALAIDTPHGLTAAQHAQLQELSASFTVSCAELASMGIPATIDHSDFHDGNILISSGNYRFIDWGDACVGHPFMTLLVTLRSIAYGAGLDEDSPVLLDLRNVYLEHWRAYGSIDDLRHCLDLACHVAMVNRALTWRRALLTLPPDQQNEYADAVPGWLQEFLNAETALR
jgi:aminoglycoside/choline kinase family phosphotransferase